MTPEQMFRLFRYSYSGRGTERSVSRVFRCSGTLREGGPAASPTPALRASRTNLPCPDNRPLSRRTARHLSVADPLEGAQTGRVIRTRALPETRYLMVHVARSADAGWTTLTRVGDRPEDADDASLLAALPLPLTDRSRADLVDIVAMFRDLTDTQGTPND
jgi:hypothetical protein